jgi:hypothetical protein
MNARVDEHDNESRNAGDEDGSGLDEMNEEEDEGEEDDASDYDDDDYMDDEDEDGYESEDSLIPDFEQVRASLHHYAQRRFVELCLALQRNDPAETKANAAGVEGYGERLGQALVGNTHVTDITLRLIPQDIYGPNVNQQHERGPEGIALLLNYLRDGPSLREFNVRGGIEKFMRPAIQAISHNPRLETLEIEDAEVPAEEMALLLRTTTALKTLSLPMVNSEIVAQALGENQTLDRLELTFDPSDAPDGIVLSHLQSHLKLTHLVLKQKPDTELSDTATMDAAISVYLRDTTGLRTLKLVGQSFNQDRMQHLVQGLQANQSLVHLTVTSCQFDQGATAVAQSFACSNIGVSLSSIFKLFVEGCTSAPELVAYLVIGCRHLIYFDWDWGLERNVSGFWNTLTTHGSGASVKVLMMGPFCGPSFDAMFTCLPKLPNLRILGFNLMHLACSTSRVCGLKPKLVRAVRQSGSLAFLAADIHSSIDNILNATHKKIYGAAIVRNGLLSDCLSKLSAETTGVEPSSEQQEERDEGGDSPPPTPVPMFPPMLVSGMETPRKSSTLVLKGLLTLSEVIASRAPAQEPYN